MLLANPDETLLAPLARRLLLDPSEATRRLWFGSRLPERLRQTVVAGLGLLADHRGAGPQLVGIEVLAVGEGALKAAASDSG